MNVYIPTYPSSQFWISYKITAPHPPGMLYYFKLFINKKCVVSWGCGKEEGFKGHTMFGLFAAPGGRGVEKRVLAYVPAAEGARATDLFGEFIEVRVYRSRGRKRVMPEVREYQGAGVAKLSRKLKRSESTLSKDVARSGGDGVDLVNAGFLQREHPQRYYRYNLLDPLDEPFATFRYYYRTWDQLEELGVVSPSALDQDLDPILSSDAALQVRSRDETTSPPNESMKTTDSPTLSHDCSPQSDQLAQSSPTSDKSPTPNNDTTTQILAHSTSIPNLNPTQEIHEHHPRPATPPISSHNPDKLTSTHPPPTIPPATIPPSTINPSIASPPLPTTTIHPPLRTIPSKEAFATLIRAHTPPPPTSTPDIINLTDLSATIQKTSSSRSRSSSPLPWKKADSTSGKNSGRKSLSMLRSVLGLDKASATERRATPVSDSESVRSGHSVDSQTDPSVGESK